MNIRRGVIIQGDKKVISAAQSPRRFGPKPAIIISPGHSNSEARLASTQASAISDNAMASVSEERRAELLRGTVFAGDASSKTTPLIVYSNSFKKTQEDIKKFSATTSLNSGQGGGSFGVPGGGDTVRQAPEVYSPLFQIANLQLPRDRITMNAWNRNFYDTHPLVHNCINLHSTYPIGKINIKCKHKKIEQFFNDMIEEMDLLGILHDIALEFWKVGECFPRAELDEDRGIWKNILIQNPDYIHVKRSVLGGDPVISLRPDAALQRLVTSNHPSDIKLRQQIDEEILYHIRKGQNIPLDNFHVSHLKMTSSPYDIRGTSVIVSIYKDLMLYDKLRECHSQDTEVLAEDGLIRGLSGIDVELDKSGEVISAKVKPDLKIACYNSDTNQIEYHHPTGVHVSKYKGKMYHFKGEKVDIEVTGDHRMWASKKISNGWSDWGLIRAKGMSMGTMYRFRNVAEWAGTGEDVTEVNVCGKNIPIDLYLEVLGYIISEGCVYNGKTGKSVSLSQLTSSHEYKKMYRAFKKFSIRLGLNLKSTVKVKGSGFSKYAKKEIWEAYIYNTNLAKYFMEEIGTNNKCKSHDKRIPRWVMSLPPQKLNILLGALVAGDGSTQENKAGKGFKYFTIAESLANDVQEVAFKCGFAPNNYTCKNGDGKEYWVTSWSEHGRGKFARVYGNKEYRNANIDQVDYDGLVWCYEVPTGLFVTRLNGKITIQGNSKFSQADNLVNPITLVSIGGTGEGEYHPTDGDLEAWRQTLEAAQYDKDFKIISHAGVKIERVGASGAVMDIATDMSFIIDNILFGLMTPKAVLTQEGASYNSASVGLEVLKQRYESFRNMITRWLKVKIFAPISEIQEFYEYDGGDKKLIVPDVEWNQMILFDMSDYISVLQQLSTAGPQGESPKVSTETLFKSLGLDAEEERRKVRKQMIQDTIAMKEKQVASGLSLSALRAIKEDEDIVEPTTEPLPGVPGADAGGMGGLGGGTDFGMGGLGGPPLGGGGGLGGAPLGGPDLGGGAPLGGSDLGGGGSPGGVGI